MMLVQDLHVYMKYEILMSPIPPKIKTQEQDVKAGKKKNRLASELTNPSKRGRDS